MSDILEAIEVLANLSEDFGIHYGEIRNHVESAGETIGPNDHLVAPHARAAGLAVVTANEREFRRVPGSRVENWLAG